MAQDNLTSEYLESDCLSCLVYAAVPLDHDVVFALNCSSSVSEKDFEKELNFSKQIAESWHIPLDTLFLYGDKAIPFHLDDAKPQFDSTCRRMDLALTEAAGSFGTKSNIDQLVVLITAGRQASGTESRDDERDRLKTATEALSERNIKVVVVAVGLDTDFKELGLIVKRPQSFYPLFSFDDMTPEKANYVASNIRKTLGEITIFCHFVVSFTSLLGYLIGTDFTLPQRVH